MTFTGYAGVLIATLAAAYLTGWQRGLFLPVARGAGIVMAALCLRATARRAAVGRARPVPAAHRPPDGVGGGPASRRADGGAADRDRLPDRSGAAGPPGGLLGPVTAAVLLTLVYAAAMALGSGLDAPSRKATSRAAAVCAVAAVLLLVGDHRSAALAVVLAVQALCTLGWAWRTGRRAPDRGRRRGLARRLASRRRAAGARRLDRGGDGGPARPRVVLAAGRCRSSRRRRTAAAARRLLAGVGAGAAGRGRAVDGPGGDDLQRHARRLGAPRRRRRAGRGRPHRYPCAC